MKNWQLFVRHAHRDTADRSLDNGLSEKGHSQGLEIQKYLENLDKKRKPLSVFSSPKVRCLETAAYVAKWAGVDVEIDQRLDEQHPGETEAKFVKRVEQFYKDTRKLSEVCFVSHGDVLPLIVAFTSGKPVEIKKGDLFFWEENKIKRANGIHSSGN